MTHRYFIEIMSNCLHPQVLLCSRFFKFTTTLQNCNKPPVRLLANLYKDDLRTVYGQNLNSISKMCDTSITELTPHLIKTEMQYCNVPQAENWRIPLLMELLDIRDEKSNLEGFSKQEVYDMLNFVCAS